MISFTEMRSYSENHQDKVGGDGSLFVQLPVDRCREQQAFTSLPMSIKGDPVEEWILSRSAGLMGVH